MPTDRDLFTEEQHMATMSFGDHIEELRVRLILALIGLVVGVILTFVPPLNLGVRIMDMMQRPAQIALERYYGEIYKAKAEEAEVKKLSSPAMRYTVKADEFINQLHGIAPGLNLPPVEQLKGKTMEFLMAPRESDVITSIGRVVKPPDALVSLAPLETLTIFLMVCMVSGLVIASPYVFYQLWAFVAAGLYRHERHYVKKFLPFSLGLFLAGVFLCFFGVLPVTLTFLLQFNMWLGIAPSLRLSEWMSFATVLPLVFGLCFQTPLIMLFLERVGIFTAEDYRSKRKIAILIMVIAAAVLTPGPDVFSQCMLAIPMIGLYELGIWLVRPRKGHVPAAAAG
ncbi:MAG TPA: twin-arginine translocase subunit TatC [Isosphaeraceae bacterium]|jgi:sec-independent protein translocase protein TatC|nr:twin-arginine translocase subunit TatC [Isosphaeraceae bacterium]